MLARGPRVTSQARPLRYSGAPKAATGGRATEVRLQWRASLAEKSPNTQYTTGSLFQLEHKHVELFLERKYQDKIKKK